MAGEWIETTLGGILTLQRGFDLPVADRRAGRYPVIASTGQVGTHDEAMVRGPGVVIGRSGSLGGGQFIEGDYWPLNTTLWVKDFKDNNPRFCYYLLRSLDLGHFNAGSGVPTLNRNHIHPLPIVAPSDPAEQRAIAHILGTLDDKIELNRRMSETLEAMARALFKSWFVDFDPVRAKLALSEAEGAEGRPSTGSGQALPGLPQPLADLFPARFVDSELGEIPEGWEVGSLGDMSALNPEVWSKHTRPPKINYVDLSNTKWGRIETVTLHDATDAPSRAQRVLRPGDTIVGTVRPGNGSYALISEDGLTGSTGFAMLRPSTPQLAQFVYLAATAAENIGSLAHIADGGAYPAVRPEVVLATPVVRSDTDLLGRFSSASGSLLAKMAHCERESRTLAALRDALLPRLISGELRIEDAERFLRRVI